MPASKHSSSYLFSPSICFQSGLSRCDVEMNDSPFRNGIDLPVTHMFSTHTSSLYVHKRRCALISQKTSGSSGNICSHTHVIGVSAFAQLALLSKSAKQWQRFDMFGICPLDDGTILDRHLSTSLLAQTCFSLQTQALKVFLTSLLEVKASQLVSVTLNTFKMVKDL